MLNSALRYAMDLIAQIHQKVAEIHRLSINRLLIGKSVHVRENIKVFLTCADQFEVYDVEVKRSLVKNDVAVFVLFCHALYQ